jgi:hypothetical protein
MEFKYGASDFIFTTMSSKDSKFDLHFKSLWERTATLCRYQLTQLQNKTLKGKYRFVAQVTFYQFSISKNLKCFTRGTCR